MMRVITLGAVFLVSLVQLGCANVRQTPPSVAMPDSPTRVWEIPAGPWDADRLKAAESILQTPPRNELEKQRQALAAAYIHWGDALFTGFGSGRKLSVAPDEKTLPAPTAEPGASGELPSGFTSPLPPPWYWSEKQHQQLDQQLQQQRDQYYRDRQPPPQFSHPPVCNSYQVGGQIYTQCR